ncbi:MAG: aspartate aminotransferase family protein [Caldisericia bacterium]|nr:aspartate aminotransferase family protein [Caldisericia bacterium]
MSNNFFKKDFFAKIVRPREKLVNFDEILKDRVKNKNFGAKTKGLLTRYVQSESSGIVSFATFDVPPVIVRAKNDLAYDADGREYIDCLSGFAASTIGQCHPEIIKTISEQSRDLIHNFDLPTVPRIELAEKLSKITPGKFEKKVMFSVTGSDATENAVRAARWYSGCQYILSAYGAYHGVTAGTMAMTSKGGMGRYYYPMMNNNGFSYFPYAYCYRCAFGKEYPSCDMFCVDYIEKNMLKGKESHLVEEKGGVSNVAAMIIEPMQCSAGYIIPPDEFLKGLKRLSDDYGFLLIVDEIQAGVGRTGRLWASEHSGIEPDIIVVGKGIAGGLPLSAIVARKEILNNWAPTAHVSTFAGYTLGCAASLKVFEIIEKENLVKRSEEIGKYFYEGLLELQKKFPIIGDVTGGKGVFLALELVKDNKTKEPAIEKTKFIAVECLEEGLLLQLGGYFYNRLTFIPALTITKSSVDRALSILENAFIKAERI